MFTTSNSYLGGGNSARPGGSQYGQQQTYFQGQQQHTNGFAPQPTGFGQAPLQQQYTGYPGQAPPQSFQQSPSQQPQYTGYPPQQQQPPPQQSLHPGQPGLQMPPKAGQTSSEIAASFSSTLAVAPSSQPVPISGAKIPKIRLSFLTATDQAKFEQLFKSAVGDGQALDGEKVKDLLIRSKLPGTDLMRIWTLSDTTKSGQLLFPEFALAMYLCNLKLVGKELPQSLPETIRNEVSSMVDIISFGVPDDRPQAPPRTNAPNFNGSSSTNPSIQQPQPQASNSQLLSQITSQPTGFASQYIPPQPTGFLNQPQTTGFQHPQQTSFQQSQQTGFQQNPQASGYQGPRPSMPPMPTGYGSNLTPSQTGIPTAMPLNAQPTGRPGQWGLVNAPATGLPNIETLQQRMMPQPGREGGYTTAGLSGSATVPWAVTKDEKKIYDELFKAWDGFKKGFIGGDAALEVMGQSGLPKSDLEKIWTLSDPGNKGRLDMDEFAVAMHLIYRKLNGYPVPNQLPPELVPPSSKNFSASLDTVRSLLSQDAEARKNSGSFLQPQKVGVSYLKNHSFRTDSNGVTPNRKDATIFRHNDDDIGYRSSARRRVGGDGRTPSPGQSTSPVSERSSDEMSSDQLRKKIREKQVLLDAMDFNDENDQEQEDALDRKDRRESEDLYRRIRRLQEDIDSHPKAALREVDSGAERRALKRQLQRLTDRLPELASQVRKTERSISDAKLELFRLRDAKVHPSSASTVVGTGPGGLVTEGDRLKARAKAMMQQRSAALRGETIPPGGDDTESAARRLEEANQEAKVEREKNESMIKDVEESVRDFSRSLEDTLREGREDSTSEHERRRWEDGLGVEDEVKDFIFDLQRSSRSAKVRKEDISRGRADGPTDRVTIKDTSRDLTPTNNDRRSDSGEVKAAAAAPSTGGSYASYKTAEERAAFIKQQAEQRMAERLAALGLKPPAKSGESAQQRQERESKERQDRLRQAEEEDGKREAERRRRIDDEAPSAPSPDVAKSTKRPPPPPMRKSRADSAAQREKKTEDDRLRAEAERQGEEKAIRDQQKIQHSETRAKESKAQDAEDELEKERMASAARLRALEEQVKQGKVKKQEEKRRKQAADRENRGKEAKLAAQRAALDEAKEKERQLQQQLENLEDDDSSDEDGPQESTPTSSQVFSRDVSSQPSEHSGPAIATPSEPESFQSPLAAPAQPAPFAQPPPAPASSGYGADTKNPFFKKLNQESAPFATTTSIASPPASSESTNPFHRMSQQQEMAKSQPLPPLTSTPTGGPISRRRQEDDEWSVVDSTSSSEDEDGPNQVTGGSAKQLASMLFGTMAPPRPLSAMDDKNLADSPTSPTAPTQAPSSPPVDPQMPGGFDDSADVPPAPANPPTPPMPLMGAPAPPPMPGSNAPPPPPMPSSGAPPPPPPVPSFGAPAALPPPPSGIPVASGLIPDRGGLLGDITKGKALKKTQTKDRSTASTAGRVLD